ncbi:hypothetical protein [Ancylobacter pratisalsi]|uniref:Uncharacterized protein n=1 Tax=Ancylobacter pratisalsi TaxID=1745854 RepID=A0A6P1YSY3_9HYPH|nr:hypothetical protein [Ancylobacter pratisalsi]QIB35173.1 hypothetical protein G3A50_16745 [Ancylobacter pratisalsi]
MNGKREVRATDSKIFAQAHETRPAHDRAGNGTLTDDTSAQDSVADTLPAPAARLRSRAATPRPSPVVIEDVIPVNDTNNGKVQQMLHLQDFLHSPMNFDLSAATLDSSSPPEEIEAHLEDLRHRIGMLNALSKVLVEELDMLEAALLRSRSPQGATD